MRKADATLAALLVFAGLTLALSDKFAAATSEAQKTPLLAAGEAILASDMWHGSGAIIGGILLQTGALLISIVMRKSQTFAKSTAYVGMVTHGLDRWQLLAAVPGMVSSTGT